VRNDASENARGAGQVGSAEIRIGRGEPVAQRALQHRALHWPGPAIACEITSEPKAIPKPTRAATIANLKSNLRGNMILLHPIDQGIVKTRHTVIAKTRHPRDAPQAAMPNVKSASRTWCFLCER
jgi:hypothetical protein